MPDMSTMMGAPPDKWKHNEQHQMKEILVCYKAALVDPLDDETEETAADMLRLAQSDTFANLLGSDLVRSATMIARATSATSQPYQQRSAELDAEEDPEDEAEAERENAALPRGVDHMFSRDPEGFLPGDSPLRSKNGEGKEPRTVPFRDFQQFEATLDFEYWKDNFRSQNSDRILSEVAQSIVAHICSAQSSGELRVRHGSVPLGKVLRKKREQITPLALCLHEIKTWASHRLRVMSVFEAATYREVERRIRYLEMLQRKEVWGAATMPLQSGMRPIAHDKLFRLMLNSREDLVRAREYSYRGYCRRASREKLGRLGNLLKDVLLNEMRIVSGFFSMNAKLSDPKTRSLQPTDLLNSWKNQTFVNYENMANVCLRSLCEVPLVRAALLSNYDSRDVQASLVDIRNWSQQNRFCLPPHASAPANEDGQQEPTFLLDDDKVSSGLLPEIYKTAAARIKEKLAEHDPHAKPPLTRKLLLKVFRKAFKDDAIIEEIMKRTLKYLAAMQDLVPALYISFQLWELAGQGGDFVLFDLMREQCIAVMQNTISRVHACQAAQRELVSFYAKVVQSHEEVMENRRLRSKRAKYQPAWVANFYVLKQDLIVVSRKSFSQAYLQLWEVAKDAWEYDLTAEQLSAKIETLRRVCEDFAPELRRETYDGKFHTADLVNLDANNWLQLKPIVPDSAAARRSKRTLWVGDREQTLSEIIDKSPDDDDLDDDDTNENDSDDDDDISDFGDAAQPPAAVSTAVV
ncbi:Hypothetical Protein FCC1311_082062 [Hondaea fermentalgiana]|uniref:Uncharacterized protein n=1 Tax=Hondaea fermentalgiana TaxID=2315210 RepID=A0A2R5GUD1_9STRA|nr:Hypothetical Protein FCC1311_082062 [Hondaea fermentalgiana]|eukprot:GBG31981.1 Hypothetical Protein FCC1311_082062 [Hondaea fermentalgiana]